MALVAFGQFRLDELLAGARRDIGAITPLQLTVESLVAPNPPASSSAVRIVKSAFAWRTQSSTERVE